MYNLVLILHSWARWAALVVGIVATLAAITDRAGRRADRAGLVFMMLADIQLLFGLMLYLVLSPVTATVLRDFGAAMRTPAVRFWAVEHAATMLLAVVLVHVGRALARTAATPQSKRVRQTVCFGLATVLMIVATPWPGMANGRPLLRV